MSEPVNDFPCHVCKERVEFDPLADSVTCQCGSIYLIGGVNDPYLVKPSEYNDRITPNFIGGEMLDYRDCPGGKLSLLAQYTNVEELQSHYD